MKQIEQSYRSGKMRLADVPVPMAAAGRNLVRTRISLISAGTEKQIIDLAKSSLVGKARARPDLVRKTLDKMQSEGVMPTVRKVFAKLDSPIPLGYSLTGTIEEAGQNAGGFAVGDRVACAGAAVANHADFNSVPKNLCVRIPDGVSDEDASFVTLGAIALQGVRVTNPTLGEVVLVMGLGLIGQLTVQLLKANGCKVVGFDPNPARAQLAKELGADVAVSDGIEGAVAAISGGHGADAVIVTASTKSSDPVNQAAELSRMKGRVVVVGLVGMQIDREPFYKRELDLRLSMSYGPGRYDPAYEEEGHDYPLPYVRWTEARNMQAFLELIAEGRVTPSKLVTHRFPIDDALSAYDLLGSKEPHLAVLLTYPEDRAIERSVEVSAQAATATGKVGVGFIGFGNYARAVLLPAVTAAGSASLRSVVTSTGLSAVNGAEKHGFAKAATDPAELFDDGGCDAVFVATRHDSHADLATRALAAGKHVFVEKPLALTEAELDAVFAAQESSGKILTVGFNRRFAPMIVKARDAIAKAGGPAVMHYRVNAGFIPGDSWLHGPQGGGRIIGEACHFVDALSALCGANPVSVEAVSPTGVTDSMQAILRFADGSTGVVTYSSLGDPSIPKEEVEVFARGLHVRLTDFRSLAITTGGKTTTDSGTQDKGQTALVKAFLDAAAGRGPTPIAADTLYAVSAATLAMAGAPLGKATDA
jgi:predicted dehydrogenase